MRVHVSVNGRTCMANQMCVRTAPDIFRVGRAGYSYVIRDVTFADLGDLEEAAELCPTGSIRVEFLGDENVPDGSGQ